MTETHTTTSGSTPRATGWGRLGPATRFKFRVLPAFLAAAAGPVNLGNALEASTAAGAAGAAAAVVACVLVVAAAAAAVAGLSNPDDHPGPEREGPS